MRPDYRDDLTEWATAILGGTDLETNTPFTEWSTQNTER